MAFIVTEPCIKCAYKECVDPCPVECFHEGPDFLVINPDGCIDCNVCATACPLNAIFQDKDVPQDQIKFIKINKILSKVYAPATMRKRDLENREKWVTVKDKFHFLNLDNEY